MVYAIRNNRTINKKNINNKKLIAGSAAGLMSLAIGYSLSQSVLSDEDNQENTHIISNKSRSAESSNQLGSHVLKSNNMIKHQSVNLDKIENSLDNAIKHKSCKLNPSNKSIETNSFGVELSEYDLDNLTIKSLNLQQSNRSSKSLKHKSLTFSQSARSIDKLFTDKESLKTSRTLENFDQNIFNKSANLTDQSSQNSNSPNSMSEKNHNNSIQSKSNAEKPLDKMEQISKIITNQTNMSNNSIQSKSNAEKPLDQMEQVEKIITNQNNMSNNSIQSKSNAEKPLDQMEQVEKIITNQNNISNNSIQSKSHAEKPLDQMEKVEKIMTDQNNISNNSIQSKSNAEKPLDKMEQVSKIITNQTNISNNSIQSKSHAEKIPDQMEKTMHNTDNIFNESIKYKQFNSQLLFNKSIDRNISKESSDVSNSDIYIDDEDIKKSNQSNKSENNSNIIYSNQLSSQNSQLSYTNSDRSITNSKTTDTKSHEKVKNNKILDNTITSFDIPSSVKMQKPNNHLLYHTKKINQPINQEKSEKITDKKAIHQEKSEKITDKKPINQAKSEKTTANQELKKPITQAKSEKSKDNKELKKPITQAKVEKSKDNPFHQQDQNKDKLNKKISQPEQKNQLELSGLIDNNILSTKNITNNNNKDDSNINIENKNIKDKEKLSEKCDEPQCSSKNEVTDNNNHDTTVAKEINKVLFHNESSMESKGVDTILADLVGDHKKTKNLNQNNKIIGTNNIHQVNKTYNKPIPIPKIFQPIKPIIIESDEEGPDTNHSINIDKKTDDNINNQDIKTNPMTIDQLVNKENKINDQNIEESQIIVKKIDTITTNLPQKAEKLNNDQIQSTIDVKYIEESQMAISKLENQLDSQKKQIENIAKNNNKLDMNEEKMRAVIKSEFKKIIGNQLVLQNQESNSYQLEMSAIPVVQKYYAEMVNIKPFVPEKETCFYCSLNNPGRGKTFNIHLLTLNKQIALYNLDNTDFVNYFNKPKDFKKDVTNFVKKNKENLLGINYLIIFVDEIVDAIVNENKGYIDFINFLKHFKSNFRINNITIQFAFAANYLTAEMISGQTNCDLSGCKQCTKISHRVFSAEYQNKKKKRKKYRIDNGIFMIKYEKNQEIDTSGLQRRFQAIQRIHKVEEVMMITFINHIIIHSLIHLLEQKSKINHLSYESIIKFIIKNISNKHKGTRPLSDDINLFKLINSNYQHFSLDINKTNTFDKHFIKPVFNYTIDNILKVLGHKTLSIIAYECDINKINDYIANDIKININPVIIIGKLFANKLYITGDQNKIGAGSSTWNIDELKNLVYQGYLYSIYSKDYNNPFIKQGNAFIKKNKYNTQRKNSVNLPAFNKTNRMSGVKSFKTSKTQRVSRAKQDNSIKSNMSVRSRIKNSQKKK